MVLVVSMLVVGVCIADGEGEWGRFFGIGAMLVEVETDAGGPVGSRS